MESDLLELIFELIKLIFEALKFVLWDWWTNLLLDIVSFGANIGERINDKFSKKK